MAIDWMPIEIETPDKPEILQVAEHLGIEPDAAFGKCFRVWGWFDRQTVDGEASGVTPTMLDHAVRSPGIAAAMESAGWLQVYEDKIVMPNFRVHCGESAKKRHQDQRRKERERAKTSVLSERDNCHANSVTDSGPRRRPETESENNKNTSGPARAGTGPGDFVSYGFELPDWPELEPFARLSVEPDEPEKLTEGAFVPLTKGHLGNPKAIATWHAKQLSIHRPVTGGTMAHRVLCVAAGLYANNLPATQVRKSRVGLFASLVNRGNWDFCRGQIPKAVEQLQGLFQAEEADPVSH